MGCDPYRFINGASASRTSVFISGLEYRGHLRLASNLLRYDRSAARYATANAFASVVLMSGLTPGLERCASASRREDNAHQLRKLTAVPWFGHDVASKLRPKGRMDTVKLRIDGDHDASGARPSGLGCREQLEPSCIVAVNVDENQHDIVALEDCDRVGSIGDRESEGPTERPLEDQPVPGAVVDVDDASARICAY